MDIPFTVRTRPDTGLYNGKLGMWLFLSSEVMLFGGLFASYVFLRMHSEVWPHGLLKVEIGFINTMILIASSITMIMAWASIKMRKFELYRGFLLITILLGCAFLSIKWTEYSDKFWHHYGVFIKAADYPKYKQQLEEEHAQVTYHPGTNVYEVHGHLEELTKDDKTHAVLRVELIPDKARGHKKDPKAPPGDEPGRAAMSEKIHVPAIAATTAATTLTGETAITFEGSDLTRSGFFWPKYNTFFAIYFAMTGLHVLHIVGGLVVMLYFFLPFGANMYMTEPEHLTNRIECTGLFWHFVDLVWIFLFPLLYLF